MRAQILFLACVAILGCQAAPQPNADEIDVEEIIQAVNDFLDNVDIEELLNSITDEETAESILETIEALRELMANIESNQETVTCLREVVDNTQYSPLDDIRVIVTESANLARLFIKRNEEIAECEAIGGDNPSAWDETRIRVCLAGVEATTGVQIAVSAFRIRQSGNRLIELEGDVSVCIDRLVPE